MVLFPRLCIATMGTRTGCGIAPAIAGKGDKLSTPKRKSPATITCYR